MPTTTVQRDGGVHSGDLLIGCIDGDPPPLLVDEVVVDAVSTTEVNSDPSSPETQNESGYLDREEGADAAAAGFKRIPCLVLLGDKNVETPTPNDTETMKQLKYALDRMSDNFDFTILDDHRNFLDTFLHSPPSFVFNLCDDGYYNDFWLEPNVPAFMDMLKIPYTGNSPACLHLCFNKDDVRAIAKEMGVRVPDEVRIDPLTHRGPLPPFNFPAFVKPTCGDGSLGISKDSLVYDTESAQAYIERLKVEMPNIPVLIQEFLDGREYGVGIIGNGDDLTALPLMEVDFSSLPAHLPKVLGFESKWQLDSEFFKAIRYVPARELDKAAADYIVDSAKRLFRRLGCRDYARFDYRMNAAGEVKLLEVNPNPSWQFEGKLCFMAQFGGLEYWQLVQMLLLAGLKRYPHLIPKGSPLYDQLVDKKPVMDQIFEIDKSRGNMPLAYKLSCRRNADIKELETKENSGGRNLDSEFQKCGIVGQQQQHKLGLTKIEQ